MSAMGILAGRCPAAALRSSAQIIAGSTPNHNIDDFTYANR